MASATSRTQPISVSLPRELVARLRQQAGPRGVSAYVQRALDVQLRREALQEWLDEFEAEEGAFTEEEMADARRRRDEAWREAGFL